MAENQNKEKQESKENHTFQIIVIVLLAVIVCFQMIHCIKLNEISYNSQLTNMAMFGGDIDMALKREANVLRMEADRIGQDIGRKHMLLKRHQPKQPPMPVEKETVDEKNKLYTIEMRIPKKLTKEDVSIDLQDNMLGVSFGGSVEMETDNSKSSDVFSVYKFFSIPETKATVKDVTYNVKDGLLKITVPLIK